MQTSSIPGKRNKTLLLAAALLVVITGMIALTACSSGGTSTNGRPVAWFPEVDAAALVLTPGVDFIPGLRGYQQTTDYTAGPAALLSVARFFSVEGITDDAETEMRIAAEAGTGDLSDPNPGTQPDEMVAWLESNGLRAELSFEENGDGSALETLRDNIWRGVPTLVEWIDIGGTWAVAVGYDDRDNDDPWDDVLILADPYDRYDDYQDGYTVVNANRFYWMWFDALYSDDIVWRTMISVTRK